MQTITHPKCGTSWTQRGERSSHCGDCCITFASVGAFDRHQTLNDDGHVVCHSPAEGARGPWWLDDDGVHWHYGRRLSAAEKERIWGKKAAAGAASDEAVSDEADAALSAA